ncbi:AcrR family transcriptional regulator [Paenibacillus shirakamiensis]|uniref:AcrR family transcriptional regulator n=1 Tax=Paenibacillus shirakamiensis TaxID=1265935 RepID=A0ABS4JG67_9BACL|nr:TetR/AcrR family transcriptional regulator [Paenibacillus shirakamiensis]MBP2000705.1 AcrR family transcriptional regulator [Paenibacillus shirakamiensis]
MSVDRRTQIMDAATKSFSMFGYKATTMDQVARIANVGKGTIYTFFANKEELFDDILQGVIAEMKRITEQKIRKDQAFFENLYDALDGLLEFRVEHELLIKLAQEVREFGTPQAREAMQRVENAILDYMERQVEHATIQGEIREVDAKVASFVLLKLYITLTLEWSKQHDPMDKDDIKSYIRLFFAEGLLPK